MVIKLYGSPNVRARFDEFTEAVNSFSTDVGGIRRDEHSDKGVELRAGLEDRRAALRDARTALALAMRSDLLPKP